MGAEGRERGRGCVLRCASGGLWQADPNPVDDRGHVPRLRGDRFVHLPDLARVPLDEVEIDLSPPISPVHRIHLVSCYPALETSPMFGVLYWRHSGADFVGTTPLSLLPLYCLTRNNFPLWLVL